MDQWPVRMITRLWAVAVVLAATPLTLDAQDRAAGLLDTLAVPVRFAQVFGERVAYYESGLSQAPTLVLLPNLGWDSHSWAQNVPPFAREYHVIAVDPLGFGRSTKPLIDYKMDTWTDMLDELMRVISLQRAIFAGAVMGGALSVQMALDHPERVLSVIVVASNTGPGPHEGGLPIPSSPSLAGTRANLRALFYDSTLVTEAFVRARFQFRMRTNDGYTIQRHLADHRSPYSREELARIEVPALVVWCREDRITPLSWGEQYAAALPRGQLAVLESCGHLPNLEQPEAFNRAVLSFLRAADIRGRAP